MTEKRPPLTHQQIEMLIHLRKWAAIVPRRFPLMKKPEREIVLSLWRRGLVHVWYRQEIGAVPADNQFFSLTFDGNDLAEILIERRAATNKQERKAS